MPTNYLVTVFGTIVGVLAVALLAYGLVQKDVPGVKVVFILILITMLFNGVPCTYIFNLYQCAPHVGRIRFLV